MAMPKFDCITLRPATTSKAFGLLSRILFALPVIPRSAYLESRYEEACRTLTRELDISRFGDLIDCLDDDDSSMPAQFWFRSKQLCGLREREVARRALIAILQVHVAKGLVSVKDARVVYRWARLQRLFALKAIAENVLCFVLPRLPHGNAWASFDMHRRITLRTWTLCRTFGAHESIFADGGVR